MPIAESVKTEEEKHKHLNREVRDMVTTITSRLTNIHKVGGSGQGQEGNDEDDDGNGVRIITLAGTNTGATLRGELDDKAHEKNKTEDVETSEGLTTYVNSNFQAVNNSIMLGGSYSTNDPGVHVEISDFLESKEFRTHRKLPQKDGKKTDKTGKKKKDEEGEGSKGDGSSSSGSSSSGSESSD